MSLHYSATICHPLTGKTQKCIQLMTTVETKSQIADLLGDKRYIRFRGIFFYDKRTYGHHLSSTVHPKFCFKSSHLDDA